MPYHRLRHVNTVRRRGRTYHYHRVTGERLPADADARAQRVIEINAGLGGRRMPRAGTFGDLIGQYKASPGYRSLAASTRSARARYLDLIGRAWGREAIGALKRGHVEAFRDTLADKPGTANQALEVLSVLCGFAVRREYRGDNPVLGVERCQAGPGNPPWPPEVVAAVREATYPELRWVIDVLLETGQRLGDATSLLWSAWDGEGLKVVQRKTGAAVWIPATPALRATLAEIPRRAAVILTTRTGRPWSARYLQIELAETVRAAGYEGYSAHGLRHTAAARLAEHGCSAHEIASITGHKTLAMVQKYTQGADQRRLASAAVLKLERRGNGFAKRPANTAKRER